MRQSWNEQKVIELVKQCKNYAELERLSKGAFSWLYRNRKQDEFKSYLIGAGEYCYGKGNPKEFLNRKVPSNDECEGCRFRCLQNSKIIPVIQHWADEDGISFRGECVRLKYNEVEIRWMEEWIENNKE